MEIIQKMISLQDYLPGNPYYPLLIYKQALINSNEPSKVIQSRLEQNNWSHSWVDGIYDFHHYHSNTHEVLVITSGDCQVQFGGENGPIYMINQGDVIIIPAGVAHKSLGKSNNFQCIGAYPLDVAPELDWDTINQQWIKGVGGAQKKLPMRVVYEYCSTDVLFNPPPKFTSRPQSSMTLYNHRTSKYEDWFAIDSKLGIDFTAHKGENHYGATATFGAVGGHTELDAMKALYEIRINEFFEFKSQATAYLEYDHQLVAPLI
ncbi:Cupin domain protein [Legionella sainthelensi]|uniref:Cupin domain protein n=1 Tax=Legionella sainthelensi TaxID=28087 RepID=A0A0W0YCH0_9GAMM|nr:cupin domain-containing protein [Legionella sainthelensi]KTD54544.1 Cupin domain protein [Legionella sainthelensi]VEH28577.1 Uncharacterized protein containing double-stranded beta helix domain [Legionella sainthelensi]